MLGHRREQATSLERLDSNTGPSRRPLLGSRPGATTLGGRGCVPNCCSRTLRRIIPGFDGCWRGQRPSYYREVPKGSWAELLRAGGALDLLLAFARRGKSHKAFLGVDPDRADKDRPARKTGGLGGTRGHWPKLLPDFPYPIQGVKRGLEQLDQPLSTRADRDRAKAPHPPSAKAAKWRRKLRPPADSAPGKKQWPGPCLEG